MDEAIGKKTLLQRLKKLLGMEKQNSREELGEIKATLQRLKKLLRGLNYGVYFKLERIVESTNIATEPISYEEFKTDICDSLSYRGDKSAGPRLSATQEKRFEQELQTLWTLLEQNFAPHATTIYCHPQTEIGVYWSFSFLILSHQQGKTYLFEGISSD